MTRTTSPAANELVRRFVDQRILVEITGFARNRRYRYDDYVRLFTEGTEVDHASQNRA
jgi:hypothetical protein